MEKKHSVPFGSLGVILAIGIVFGDIGTSPLYVMRAVIHTLPDGQLANPDYILGAVSCVIWTLTILTTIKYVVITLRADNKGEGGILSLFALIRRKYRWAYIIAAVGAAMLLADGVITPAMTVTSAIEGLDILVPDIPVMLITIVIVLLIFLLQPFGTGAIGKYFGPFMVLWFLMMTVVGFSQLIQDISVLRAFNPWYAIHFLLNVPEALVIMGAIFLCTTGAEALYSDLGHCGLKNIRVAWAGVKVALIINYLGQAAWVINNPAVITHGTNPFYAIMPSWFLIAGIVMATLAAIIASQALISGSYSVISEAISMNLWPNVKIKYPSMLKGQLFIPSVNYSLMVLCILVILVLQTSIRMEAAYGLAITLSMMMTSILLFLYFVKNKKPLWYSIPVTLFFVAIEFIFFIANMQKFGHGGFVPILIGGVVFIVMYSWYNGTHLKKRFTQYDQINEQYISQIDQISQDATIPKTATHLVYLTSAKRKDNIETKVTYSLFRKMPKRADTYWFINIQRTDEPYEFGYETTVFVPKKVFRLDIRAGFKLGIHTDRYVGLIVHDLERRNIVDLSTRYPSLKDGEYNKGDFLYVIVERVIRNVEKKPMQSLVLLCYKIIKHYITSDAQMYDLDPSLAVSETVPLYRHEHTEAELQELLLQADFQNHKDSESKPQTVE
ncbi:KUP/HAK/KT family potassium transporter [Dysgonomonas sp. 25]|uniref:KUP/HAK/KT family potassium transporter n=1 Tax=Dysgonomonas sp. 25 TaxID=2302933 RepID=UPI0013D6B493|nr:KUP/HAK/KT family potassium transporter [Dysgonomonas sp. 25]NDV68072.1 potassium transporter Kup [Dysgonomonas sp. 25]